MYTFLLVLHVLVAASLVGVILMQRSEGGGLAGGGNPSGLMTARGAADFLTRTTTILAILFVLLSIAMAGVATVNRAPATLDTSLAKTTGPVVPAAPVVPLAGDANAVTAPALTAPAVQVPVTNATSAAVAVKKVPVPTPTPGAKRDAVAAPKPVVKATAKTAGDIVPPVITAPLTKPATTPLTENAPQ